MSQQAGAHHSSSPPPASTPGAVSSPPLTSDADGEDLLDENMARDYRPIRALDTYNAMELATGSDVEEMTPETRRKAEREIRKRARRENKRRRRARGLPSDDSEDDDDDVPKPIPKRLHIDDEEKEKRDVPVNLDDFKGPLREWIALDRPRAEIKRRFGQFLRSFVDAHQRPVYPAKISKMCQDNKESLLVSYSDLSVAVPLLAIWVADCPSEILELFDEEATRLVLTEYFPQYEKVASEIHVRLTDLPIVDSIRDLRHVHLNVLIKISGVVTRRSAVFPQLKVIYFRCGKCANTFGPFPQNSDEPVNPGRCPDCQSQGPFSVNYEQTVYRNYQKVTLQESPGQVPAGRVPRQKDVILLHDLIDVCRPGEEVEVTGVYTHNFDTTLNSRNGFPVFHTLVEANYINKKAAKMESFLITTDDKQKIIELSKKPDVADIIFRSIAPSIYGHENIKVALALSLFSGVPKQLQNKHRIRGDINLLILGDPGCGKSQFLKYAEKTAHRAVYTTGKGASAVGLTASVRKDPLTREWTLEGGALVLADEGICLIDEFDKMNDQDRTSIHEAMEQQSISISKAGIITTLQARCAVIAAANPVMGRYDTSVSFADNVQLTDAILSRFDILCVVRDTVDPVVDEKLASFVVDSHMKNHPHAQDVNEDKDDEDDAKTSDASSSSSSSSSGSSGSSGTKETISQDLLRKYISYAKLNVEPKLQNIDNHKITALYAELRRESMVTGGIPIAVRHIESIIRMSEAHARIHLRNYVNDDDVNMAIRVMLDSFFGTQKFAVMTTLRKQFRKYLTYKKDHNELLLYILQQLVRDQLRMKSMQNADDSDALEVPVADFVAQARDNGISSVSEFYKTQLFTSVFTLDSKRKVIVKTA